MKSNKSKDYLTNRQAILMLMFFLFGSLNVENVAKGAGIEAPFVIITANILIIPMYLLYGKILCLYPHYNIYEILVNVFGKVIGKFITIIFIFNGIYIASLEIRTLAEFMQIAGLINTPYLSTILLICLTSILLIKNGLNIFGKWLEFFFIVIFIAYLVTSTLFIPLLNPKQMLPLFYDGYDKYIETSFQTLAFPYATASIFMSLFNNVKDPKDSPKLFTTALFFSFIMILSFTTETLLVVGGTKFSTSYFPVYIAARRVKLGAIIQRVEFNIVINLAIMSIARLVTCIFSAVIGIGALFNFKSYTTISVPVVLLCGILAFVAYENILEREAILDGPFVYYSLFINLFIPLLIFISYYIKRAIIKKT